MFFYKTTLKRKVAIYAMWIIMVNSHLPVIDSMIIDQYLPHRHERQLNKHASTFLLFSVRHNIPSLSKFKMAAGIKIYEISVSHFPICCRIFFFKKSQKATNTMASASPDLRYFF